MVSGDLDYPAGPDGAMIGGGDYWRMGGGPGRFPGPAAPAAGFPEGDTATVAGAASMLAGFHFLTPSYHFATSSTC